MSNTLIEVKDLQVRFPIRKKKLLSAMARALKARPTVPPAPEEPADKGAARVLST